MEWQDWLEKGDKEIKKKPTMFPRIRREFEDEKDEDPMVYDNKTASWESWLEKNDPCWEGYEQYGMKDKDGKKVPNCVKKNNATETSHKEGEKKEEWNGKFDNSTTRDDAENDDDKAIGEEESLEELTDGKLEEVEKLKSWQIFLKGFGGTEEDLIHEEDEIMGKKNMHGLHGRYQNPKKHRKNRYANQHTGRDAVQGTKRIPTPKKGAFKDTKETKHMSSGDHKAVAQRVAGVNSANAKFMTDVNPTEMIGAGTDKRVLTDQEHDDLFHENTQPELNTERKRASPKALAARRARMKSWELFLEKGITYEDTNPKETDPEKIMESAKNPRKKITLTPDMKKSWNEWLEKMQGAGDARYGNQHLTGMEQKPVADDESIDLSAESEENNEKQEKTEDKEYKDNKPYKALSQE
jgi:hypothetical protein